MDRIMKYRMFFIFSFFISKELFNYLLKASKVSDSDNLNYFH